MGVTISWLLRQNGRETVKKTLDRAEQHAKAYKQQAKSFGLDSFVIRRLSDTKLFIDIDGCETLGIDFQTAKEIKEEAKKTKWTYLYDKLTDNGKKPIDEGYKIQEFPQNEAFYASGFCKTQYAKNVSAHRFIAEILRIIACFCPRAEISDEGDYYHTGDINDAIREIEGLGAVINSLGGIFTNLGYEVTRGGETTIKSHKTKVYKYP